jgi:hydroxymethylglutaryl-CoA reductase
MDDKRISELLEKAKYYFGDSVAHGLDHTKNVLKNAIEISEKEAMKRNILRGRSDDTEEGLRKRFNEYKNNVVPSMNYFKDKKLVANWKLSNGKIATIVTYNKSPGEIIKTAVKNGFEVIDYEDTKPMKSSKKKSFGWSSEAKNGHLLSILSLLKKRKSEEGNNYF